MTEPAPIKIARAELFTPDVDKAVARQRALSGRSAPEAEPVSPIRRVLLSSMFYLPLAGVLGAAAAHAALEPFIADGARVAGSIALVNSDPFDSGGLSSMTIGNEEVLFDPEKLQTMVGERGQPALESAEAIRVGEIVDVIGDDEDRRNGKIVAYAARRTTAEDAAAITRVAERHTTLALMGFFPCVATLIAFGLLLAEGAARRNWSRTVERGVIGSALAALFAFLMLIPGGMIFLVGHKLFKDNVDSKAALMVLVTCRSIAWACAGAGTGLGMNISRATRAELRNSVVGGALGGAFGGLFFDPVEWLTRPTLFADASTSRLVGACAVGLSVGVFVALLEQLTREAWIRVRTGPLAGKSFVLYRTPTTIGSAPSADIYLFKDAGIDPHHASIHRSGQTYEIEDRDSRKGTAIGGEPVRRRRLQSGDQITIGDTVLEFEERARRVVRPAAGASAEGKVPA